MRLYAVQLTAKKRTNNSQPIRMTTIRAMSWEAANVQACVMFDAGDSHDIYVEDAGYVRSR